ncbi:40S ribosomal protein S12, mitochondrial isoform X2 [Leptopilina boulardi]|uniref:40S ribosomal protein S12, mitochondrial isoform X2 n=1 Tax=Leptopilina boulardi TaxID=63433 RepID=UPI0021F5240A|nr:40S ribosomal protein S12, mitochondrial isoform X2 [Leptopilina boulardi]
MSLLVKSVSNIAKYCLRNNIQGNTTSIINRFSHSNCAAALWNTGKLNIMSNIMKSFNTTQGLSGLQCTRYGSSLWQMHKRGPRIKKRKRPRPLDGNPFLKGVILKTLIKKPRKPNSANRKCVLVRLSNGKEMTAFVPGVGHNLQEHNVVLVRCGRVRDLPGVKVKCVRGKYDLPHVVKKTQ